jgi:hypothetical protein
MSENVIPFRGATAGPPLHMGPWEHLARAMHLAEIRRGICEKGVTFDEWACVYADEVTELLTALAAVAAQRTSEPN